MAAQVVGELVDCSKPTVYHAFGELEELGILTAVAGDRRTRRYHYAEILEITEAPVSVLEADSVGQ